MKNYEFESALKEKADKWELRNVQNENRELKNKEMKNLFIILLFLFICVNISAQVNRYESILKVAQEKDDSIYKKRIIELTTYNNSDSVNKYCKERGHVFGKDIKRYSIHTESYILDLDSISYMVTPSDHYMSYICERCKQRVIETIPDRKEVIWIKR
jgi:hypothetical protein